MRYSVFASAPSVAYVYSVAEAMRYSELTVIGNYYLQPISIASAMTLAHVRAVIAGYKSAGFMFIPLLFHLGFPFFCFGFFLTRYGGGVIVGGVISNKDIMPFQCF